MVYHQASLISKEHDTPILEGSHPQNLVIPHLRPLLVSLHEEAVSHYIRNLLTVFSKIQKFILFHLHFIFVKQLFCVQTDFNSVGTTYKNKSKGTLHLTTYMNSLLAYIKAKFSSSLSPFM